MPTCGFRSAQGPGGSKEGVFKDNGWLLTESVFVSQ